jgi:hypothetical protein
LLRDLSRSIVTKYVVGGQRHLAKAAGAARISRRISIHSAGLGRRKGKLRNQQRVSAARRPRKAGIDFEVDVWISPCVAGREYRGECHLAICIGNLYATQIAF